MEDWQAAFGRPTLLAETFVDPDFQGTCYRTAGRQGLGRSPCLGTARHLPGAEAMPADQSGAAAPPETAPITYCWWQLSSVGIRIGINDAICLTWSGWSATNLISNLLEVTPGTEPGIAVLQMSGVSARAHPRPAPGLARRRRQVRYLSAALPRWDRCGHGDKHSASWAGISVGIKRPPTSR